MKSINKHLRIELLFCISFIGIILVCLISVSIFGVPLNNKINILSKYEAQYLCKIEMGFSENVSETDNSNGLEKVDFVEVFNNQNFKINNDYIDSISADTIKFNVNNLDDSKKNILFRFTNLGDKIVKIILKINNNELESKFLSKNQSEIVVCNIDKISNNLSIYASLKEYPSYLQVQAYEPGEEIDKSNNEKYPYYINMGIFNNVTVKWIVVGATLEDDFGDGNTYGNTINSTTILCTDLNRENNLYDYDASQKIIYINGKPAKKLLLISQYTLGYSVFGNTPNYFNAQISLSVENLANKIFIENGGLSEETINKHIVLTNIPKTTYGFNTVVSNQNQKLFLLGDNSTYNNWNDSFGVCTYFGDNNSLFGSDADNEERTVKPITGSGTSIWWLRTGRQSNNINASHIDGAGRVYAESVSNSYALRPIFVMNMSLN